jgi:hypothetical protein
MQTPVHLTVSLMTDADCAVHVTMAAEKTPLKGRYCENQLFMVVFNSRRPVACRAQFVFHDSDTISFFSVKRPRALTRTSTRAH